MEFLYGAPEKEPGFLDEKTVQPFLLHEFRCAETRLAISPDSRLLLTASYLDRAVRIWDLNSRENLSTWSSTGGHAQFARKGTAILYVDERGVPCQVDLMTYKTIFVLKDAPRGIRHAVLSPGERFIATGSADRTVRIWNVETGKEFSRYELYPNKSGVNYVAWSPDGRFIAACGYPRTIRMWEVASGKQVLDLAGHRYGVNCITFSHDGSKLLSGSSDRTMRLWDVTSGRALQRFKGHINWVNAVAFSPDGRSVISAGDETVRLWDVETGTETNRVGTHEGTVYDLVLIPYAHQVISAGDDGVKEWKLP
jgi:WD40 repeat protein